MVADHGAQKGAAEDRSRKEVLFPAPGLHHDAEPLQPNRQDDPCAGWSLTPKGKAPSGDFRCDPGLRLVVSHNVHLEDVAAPHELRSESALRPVIDFERRADLFEAAAIQNGDPVGDGHRLLLVVGDEDPGGLPG